MFTTYITFGLVKLHTTIHDTCITIDLSDKKWNVLHEFIGGNPVDNMYNVCMVHCYLNILFYYIICPYSLLMVFYSLFNKRQMWAWIYFIIYILLITY